MGREKNYSQEQEQRNLGRMANSCADILKTTLNISSSPKHRSSYQDIDEERPKEAFQFWLEGPGKPPFFHSLLFSMSLHPRPQATLWWQRQPCQQAPEEPTFCGRGPSSIISGTVAPRGRVFLLCPPGLLIFLIAMMKKGALKPESTREIVKRGSLGKQQTPQSCV